MAGQASPTTDNRMPGHDMQSLRAKAEGGDKAAALELAEDDELFKHHMQPEEREREARAKIRRVDPTVNLAADGFDRWSEGATARDPSKVCLQSDCLIADGIGTAPVHKCMVCSVVHRFCALPLCTPL